MSQLLTLAWADIEAFSPCHTKNGESIPEWGRGSGTMLDILRYPEINSDDKVWALTCGVQSIADKALQDKILRLFACKCVRSTPLGDGRVVWDLLTDERSRNAVEVSERFARGEATQEELDAARDAARNAARNAARAAWAAWDAAGAAWDAWDAAGAALDALDAAWAYDSAAMYAAARAAQVQFAIDIIEQELKEVQL